MFDTWAHRLMIKDSNSSDDQIDVRYQSKDQRGTIIEETSPSLPEFIYFLAHNPIPESTANGLNLTYSRTVGVLHSLWREEYLIGEDDKTVDFKAQQDRLLAAIDRLTSNTVVVQRQNFDDLPEPVNPSRYIEIPEPAIVDEDVAEQPQ